MASPTVHFYTAPCQPATRWVVELFDGRRMWMRCARRRLVRCWSCRRLRWAQNCVVQVFYDQVPHYCARGHGCARPCRRCGRPLRQGRMCSPAHAREAGRRWRRRGS